MAFENTAKAQQSFLAAKTAGAHPLAQHLNFKSALKEARIAMASKQLEAERERGLKRSEGALNRESLEKRTQLTTEATIGAAEIRAAVAGAQSPADVLKAASGIARQQAGILGRVEGVKADSKSIAIQMFAMSGIDPQGIGGITQADVDAFNAQQGGAPTAIDTDIDELDSLTDSQIFDREF